MASAKKILTSAIRSANPISAMPAAWRGKGLVRVLLLLAAAAVIAGLAAAFGIARDYGYLHASILTGAPTGQYHALATRLADRAKREHGSLTVVPTAGSIENVSRLVAGQGHCAEMFAIIQDGTPVSADMQLELLGRLPEPKSLLLLGKQGHAFNTFADLRGASIGIGPEGSGTAYLMRQLFADSICTAWMSVCRTTDYLNKPNWSPRVNSTLPPTCFRRTPNFYGPSSAGTSWISCPLRTSTV